MVFDIAGQSHTGSVRAMNQDKVAWHLCNDQRTGLMVVADGMGGYQGGEVASHLAVSAVMDALVPELYKSEIAGAGDSIAERLQAAFYVANERIVEQRAHDPALEKMGTTLVVAWLTEGCIHISHVGDSRCYLLRNGQLRCLTRDDTVVQNMLDDGSITRNDAENVPFKNVLTRAVGALARVDVSYLEEPLGPGDKLLLCSDGLTGAVTDSVLEDILNTTDNAGRVIDVLIDTALANHASDNVSAVLLSQD
jgi:protein phosphatase